MKTDKTGKQQGFTLIEVMIVVVIVAILASIAIPSYQSHIQKTRRTDAKEALTRAAAAQERYFFTHNSYTDDETALGFTGNLSQDGYYTITAVTTPTAGTKCSADPCFVVQATPVATKSQSDDTTCGQFDITHTGRKSAHKKGDASADTTDQCW